MTRNEEYLKKFADLINEYFGKDPTPPDAHAFLLALVRDIAIMIARIEGGTNYKADA